MNLNRLVMLGVTSLLVSIAPISYAIAEPAPVQSGLQNSTDKPVTVAQTQTGALYSGTFAAGEAPTTGTARIVSEGGHRYLELDAAFTTSNQGPDLHVLLDTPSRPPGTYANLGSALNLGGLQSPTGAQRYPIPDAINLQNYGSVVIWCRMANATFGYAPLRSVSGAVRGLF
jgi:Electron transfer DM13